MPMGDSGLFYIDLDNTAGKREYQIDVELLKDEKTRLKQETDIN